MVGMTVTCTVKYSELMQAHGRFSVFEATANSTAAGMFTRLCKDPTVKTETAGFPWTAVKEIK
jgi:hypothetical protein